MNGTPEPKKRLRSLRTLGRFMSIRGYRHAGPMDLKTRFFADNAGEGQALALRLARGFVLVNRSAGACPPQRSTSVLPLREPFFPRVASLGPSGPTCL